MPQPVMLKKCKLNGSMNLHDFLELTPKKDVLFIIGAWNASRKSRDTGNNRQIWPWSTKQSRANRVLPKCTGHSKHPLPKTQDSTPGHHQMVNTEIRLIIFFAAKDGEALYSQQK